MTPDKPFTIVVALLGSILSLVLPRRWALVPLALSLCLYPSNLLLPPDGMGFTAQRLIAVVLLARCLLSQEIRSRFTWGLVDYTAAGYFLLLLVSQLTTTPLQEGLVNRVGFFLSAMVPFWCARFLITDRESFLSLFKGWLWAAVPLALVGLYQMNTGNNPYFAIQRFGILWGGEPNRQADMRALLGVMFYRASSPFMQCIMFGWFFGLLVAPSTNLFWEKRKLWPWGLAWLFLPVGAISAMASGPMMLAAFTFGLLLLFPLRAQWRTFAWIAAILFVGTTFLSNRSPMELIASLGSDVNSSYYRVALQDQILKYGRMAGHWLFGYGAVPPFFGRYRDLCIHWIYLLVIYGVAGVIGFHALVGVASWSLWKASYRAQSIEDQWLLWSLFSTVLGSLAAMLVVALFSEMHYIYHMFLGVVANATLLVGSGARQVGVLAEMNGQTVLLRYTLKPGQRLAIVHPPSKPQGA